MKLNDVIDKIYLYLEQPVYSELAGVIMVKQFINFLDSECFFKGLCTSSTDDGLLVYRDGGSQYLIKYNDAPDVNHKGIFTDWLTNQITAIDQELGSGLSIATQRNPTVQSKKF